MSTFELSGEAIRRREARDRRDGLRYLTHRAGLCGNAVAACCGACYQDEVTELRAWAVLQPAPRAGEDEAAYWRRIGGRFLDAWHQVAAERTAAAWGVRT